jgi:two-component system sensor kinase FixL
MEPLYSTKSRGIGLGLAISLAVLKKNGGDLSVTSELGKGSTFVVTLRAVTVDGAFS